MVLILFASELNDTELREDWNRLARHTLVICSAPSSSSVSSQRGSDVECNHTTLERAGVCRPLASVDQWSRSHGPSGERVGQDHLKCDNRSLSLVAFARWAQSCQ